jgi:hypothetical protein
MVKGLIHKLLRAATLSLASLVTTQPAQAYPVDCAILLCLAGGWPASAECTHARAVFIRRITPWPIEPPLQIWRCPMGVSYNAPGTSIAPQVWSAQQTIGSTLTDLILAQDLEGGADIDISGLEFDFVRSIRVWDVRHYSHRERGRDDDCSESYNMHLGTYGTQGEFGKARHQRPPRSGFYRRVVARHRIGDAGLAWNGKITKGTTDMSG